MPGSEPLPRKVDRQLGSALEHGPFVFLQPGGLVVADVPTRVKTILGSCVALTVRAPWLGLAVVTHCLLPSAGKRLDQLSRTETLKYVDATVVHVLQIFSRHGAMLPDLEVKVIGGADSLSTNGAPYHYSVGSRNVAVALKALADRGIVPAASIVGGRTGRVLVFDTGNGDVFVKRLPARLCSFQEQP